jgi:hypothetical protein
MPILVTCSCGKEYLFKDAVAGRRAKCLVCGQPVQIPGTRVPRPGERAAPQDAPAADHPPAQAL